MLWIQAKPQGITWFILFSLYLFIMAYFALRPFNRIPGLSSGRPPAGYEDAAGGRAVYNALVKSGQMTLVARFRPQHAEQNGSARIISLSRNHLVRNFTLGQEGRDLSFRLRTEQTSENAVNPSLTVSDVFNAGETIHVVLTYDGHTVDAYLNGKRHPDRLSLSGSFATWGRDQLLVVGDEPVGGRPWQGEMEFFRIYDTALSADNVAVLYAGGTLPKEPLYAAEGIAEGRSSMGPLRYRNLFVITDPVFNLRDVVVNMLGFMPLALFIYMLQVHFFNGVMQRGTLFAMVLAAGLVISTLFESTQRILIGRVPCLMDILYNGFGTLVGYLLLRQGLAYSGFKQTKD